MIDMAKKYQTRDGREVRVLCVDSPDRLYKVVAIVRDGNDWEPTDFTADGHEFRGAIGETDLIEVKPEYTRWIVVDEVFGHKTEAEAIKSARTCDGDVAVVKITFRPGDGL
jgi:hypothetical protein